MSRKKPLGSPVQMNLIVRGDKRVAENIIIEVRAIAERRGLEIPSVRVVQQPAVGPKTAKLMSRGRGSKARRRSGA
jgi:hypothetical protein